MHDKLGPMFTRSFTACTTFTKTCLAHHSFRAAPCIEPNAHASRYFGANVTDPVTNDTSSNALVETNLHPLTNATAPGVATVGAADVNLNLDIQFNVTALDFTVNGVSFVPPTAPVLLQILSGAASATDLLPSGSVYSLPANKVIEISMPGGSVGSPVSALDYPFTRTC